MTFRAKVNKVLCQKYTSIIHKKNNMIRFDIDQRQISYNETEILEGRRSLIKKRNLLEAIDIEDSIDNIEWNIWEKR